MDCFLLFNRSAPQPNHKLWKGLGPRPLLWFYAPYVLHKHSSWYQRDMFWLICFISIFFTCGKAIWSTVIIAVGKARGAQTFELFWKKIFISLPELLLQESSPEREGSYLILYKLALLSCSERMLRCSEMSLLKYKYRNLFKNEA